MVGNHVIKMSGQISAAGLSRYLIIILVRRITTTQNTTGSFVTELVVTKL